MHDVSSRQALVLAIAHELGNHLAGIRLEAHLLDESMGAVGLARASLTIDGLAGRSGPLLSLIRPLLVPARRGTGSLVLADLLEGVRRALEDAGTAGHPVEVRIETDPAVRAPVVEGLHALLLALVGAPDELPSGRGAIVLGLRRQGNGLELVCALPGAAPDELDAAHPLSSLRGRALAVAIARVLVADAGGEIEVVRSSEGTQIALRWPAAEQTPSTEASPGARG